MAASGKRRSASHLWQTARPPPLPQQRFVFEGLENSLEGGGGLEGGEGALSPFNHKPTCTVLPIVHMNSSGRATAPSRLRNTLAICNPSP